MKLTFSLCYSLLLVHMLTCKQARILLKLVQIHQPLLTVGSAIAYGDHLGPVNIDFR